MRPSGISIQFCGGCNPRINREEIAREIRQALEEKGFKVSFNDPEPGFVIFLSGCLSGCAFKFNPRNPPYVQVADHTVDAEAVEESRIVALVLKNVKTYFERLEARPPEEHID